MGERLNLIEDIHVRTQRDYLGRMLSGKVSNMELACQFGFDFFDGSRETGYGGYKFIEGWFDSIIDRLIARYRLNSQSSVLDVGCGKGFFLKELRRKVPGITVRGFDISEYAIKMSDLSVRNFLSVGDAGKPFPFERQQFDLVVSLGTLHNINLNRLKIALNELTRVGKRSCIVVDAYDDCESLFNLQCWALTAKLFLTESDWMFLFDVCSFDGDYDFLFYR